MLKQKLHLCIDIQKSIQVNQYWQSILQFSINAKITIKLSDVTVNYCNYRL